MPQLAMVNDWEIILVLAVLLVLLGFRARAEDYDTTRRAKRFTFYFLMTASAIGVGCLLALAVTRLMQP